MPSSTSVNVNRRVQGYVGPRELPRLPRKEMSMFGLWCQLHVPRCPVHPQSLLDTFLCTSRIPPGQKNAGNNAAFILPCHEPCRKTNHQPLALFGTGSAFIRARSSLLGETLEGNVNPAPELSKDATLWARSENKRNS